MRTGVRMATGPHSTVGSAECANTVWVSTAAVRHPTASGSDRSAQPTRRGLRLAVVARKFGSAACAVREDRGRLRKALAAAPRWLVTGSRCPRDAGVGVGVPCRSARENRVISCDYLAAARMAGQGTPCARRLGRGCLGGCARGQEPRAGRCRRREPPANPHCGAAIRVAASGAWSRRSGSGMGSHC